MCVFVLILGRHERSEVGFESLFNSRTSAGDGIWGSDSFEEGLHEEIGLCTCKFSPFIAI